MLGWEGERGSSALAERAPGRAAADKDREQLGPAAEKVDVRLPGAIGAGGSLPGRCGGVLALEAARVGAGEACPGRGRAAGAGPAVPAGRGAARCPGTGSVAGGRQSCSRERESSAWLFSR